MGYVDSRKMRTLIAIAAFAFPLVAAESKSALFEIRGKILPHHSATVSLYAVSNPFTISTQAGRDGGFHFQNVEAGIYTLSVYVPHHGETRRTIPVDPAMADNKGHVTITVDTEAETLDRESVAKISVQEWKIPAQARRAYEEAKQRLSEHNVNGAIASLQRAVEVDPQFAAAWNHLGTIAYQAQQYQEAENYFRQGMAADPGAYEPLVNLGGVLINLGHLTEAQKCNEQASRRRPNDPTAQSQLGMTYLFLNQLDLAEQHLLMACRLDPAHFSYPQLHLAELYSHKQDFHRAADQLTNFLKYHPDWPNAAVLRANIEKWHR